MSNLLAGPSRPRSTPLPADDNTLAQGKKKDIQAVALVLAETFAAGTCSSEDGILGAATLQRLMFDLFHQDITQLRDYIVSDPELVQLGQFLDEQDGAGWAFLDLLLQGEASCDGMLEHSFLEEGKGRKTAGKRGWMQ